MKANFLPEITHLMKHVLIDWVGEIQDIAVLLVEALQKQSPRDFLFVSSCKEVDILLPILQFG